MICGSGKRRTIAGSAEITKNGSFESIFRLGECYRKLNKTNEAIAHYERVVREFGDLNVLANLSRQNLTVLGGVADPVNARAIPAVPLRNGLPDPETMQIKMYRKMIEESPDLINAPFPRSYNGLYTPLEEAARNGHLKAAEFLLDGSVRMDPSNLAGSLVQAASNGNKAMTELLLGHGADANRRNSDGVTALHAAAGKGFRAIVEVLLKHGADVSVQSEDGETPLHKALGNQSVVEQLVGAKADVNARNRAGETPLFAAVAMKKPDTVKFLLINGADVNSKGEQDLTPLHIAAAYGAEKISELLLERGAEVNAKDVDGLTPLHYAAGNSHLGIIEILLKNGADRAARTLGNQTPRDIANKRLSGQSGTAIFRIPFGNVSNDSPIKIYELLELKNP